LAKKIRDAWATFAKDPVYGLEKMGWPLYNPDSTSESDAKMKTKWNIYAKPFAEKTVVILGGPDSADIKFDSPSSLDYSCHTIERLQGGL
jgi:cholinesterase